MTFEASRKKQSLVLQPKGKPLYEESSSFGLKMLQNWGWQKGNGLGKNQQGNLEFIKLRYKNNANGLGFDGLKDNQWTENESNFDSLLKNLNSQSNSNSNSGDEERKKPSKSLEEQSKQSRARVHYKKFTRGKDVFKYSEKDLANILGKKTLDDSETKKEEEQKKEEVEEEEDDKLDTYNSDLIVNTGVSINDYFKQMKNRKQNGSNTNGTEDIDEEPVKKKNKKRKVEEEEEAVQEEVRDKSKKKKRQDPEEVEVVENELEVTNKKKKKRKEENNDDLVVEEEKVKDKSKKKKKQVPEESPIVANENELEVTKKKKDKKRRDEEEVVDEEKSCKKKKNKTNNENPVTNESVPADQADRPKGANAIYSNEVIQIPSHVASKMSNVQITNFYNANLGDIVGYGMHEDIEIKVVQTKMGDKNLNSTDKYSLYNMDKMTKKRVNPKKIFTKLKKTKKSIQII